MTTLVYQQQQPARHDNITVSEHGQSAARFTLRALHPGAAVILVEKVGTVGFLAREVLHERPGLLDEFGAEGSGRAAAKLG
jgi:hypothetical protein